MKSFSLTKCNASRDIPCALVPVVILVVLAVLYYGMVGRDNQWGLYDSFVIGEEVQSRMGNADGFVRFAGKRVYYFMGHGRYSQTAALPASVETVAELPFVYDAIQLMVDEKGVLLAKGWCGETYHVESIWGQFPGSDLTKLGAGVVPALIHEGETGK